jgi:SOS response regulatory protein OraA/RecX
VRAFLRYVDGKAAEGKFVKAVEDEVMRVKEHKETRREYMTYAMEIKRRELASFAEGEKKKETMMILAMLRKGFSVESIAECAQTSVEYIMELGKKNHLL